MNFKMQKTAFVAAVFFLFSFILLLIRHKEPVIIPKLYFELKIVNFILPLLLFFV